MKQELQEKLYKKYPKIFQDKDKSMEETCMCWGIDCNDGWYWLIDKLCSNLQFNTDHNNKEWVVINKKTEKFFNILSNLTGILRPEYDGFFNKDIKTSWNTKFHAKLNRIIGKLKTKHVKKEYINTGKRYPQIIATQVKEKYGRLRFYVQRATDAQYAIIIWAESLSYDICEKCGSTKEVGQTKGWVTTLCKECAIKKDPELINWKENET
jgi:hypothetical protein